MMETSLEFKIHLFLGVTQEERNHLQQVIIDFSLLYKKQINNLLDQDFICYQQIADKLFLEFNNSECGLIEHLTLKIYSSIREITKDCALIRVQVKKSCPYITKTSKGSAKCEYRDY